MRNFNLKVGGSVVTVAEASSKKGNTYIGVTTSTGLLVGFASEVYDKSGEKPELVGYTLNMRVPVKRSGDKVVAYHLGAEYKVSKMKSKGKDYEAIVGKDGKPEWFVNTDRFGRTYLVRTAGGVKLSDLNK